MWNAIKTLGTQVLLLLSAFVITACARKEIKTRPPRVHTVEIMQMQFQPDELWVRRGDTVVFVNKDLVTHNVTEAYNAWASSPLETGKSWRMVVDKHEDFFCTIHPMMKGRLRVINNLMQ